ncbi:MAG: beta-CASP ribonuclease aCPSF1 [Candidatus Nitrosocaldus sp.]|nr:beta-CASP ribonuclease aCPSF1 [Candidatus Nitrosocaldus sp.]MDW7999835.1 beta-CASP ribonuclease aCPSF1 [Candidatus Nitrosocaldus sp.]
MSKVRTNSVQSIIGMILQNIPSDAAVTKIEYEGPMIAIYTRNPRYLLENNAIISGIVKSIKKRIVVRTDESIRKGEEEARKIIMSMMPKEVGIVGTFFDTALGEVTVEVKKPWMLTQVEEEDGGGGEAEYREDAGEGGSVSEAGFSSSTSSSQTQAHIQRQRQVQALVVDLIDSTGWKVRIRKASHIPSESMKQVNYAKKLFASERYRLLRNVGESIFRPRLLEGTEATLVTLGGFSEVGRSCMLLMTRESRILLDCGINPGASEPINAFPRLDMLGFDLEEIDAVVISHAHLDHTGFLPLLFKHGYRGPVYCTEPTLPLMTLIQMDMIKVAAGEGELPLYTERDVREVIKHTITLPYKTVTDIAPDIKLVFANAGHILGSATVHLHIGNGDHNIVYTGDLKYGRSQLFDSASWNYPRVETLIIESTYGAKEDVMPSREEVESNFVGSINKVLMEGGKVLIPVPAVGRAQEILMVIDHHMKAGKMVEAPVFIEGMISEASAIHVAHPEYLTRELRQRILEVDDNPFTSEYFTIVEHSSQREEALREGPAIIMATSGMLEGGPVIEYFKGIAKDARNKILFVSYQVNGTLGRRVLDGSRQISLMGRDGKIEVIDIMAQVEKIEGFSGHSDYNQLIAYVNKLKPKLRRVIVNHGERRKVENLAGSIYRIFKVPATAPMVREALRLY